MSSETSEFKATETCAMCRGRCCRHMGCHYSPRDFKDLSYEGLKREIEKGRISIDWWVGEEPEYYLRARHIGEPIVCGSWGGTCVNLTENGCSLAWEDRPLGGRALKPGATLLDDCEIFYSKEECKNEWKPYSHILIVLAAYYTLVRLDSTAPEGNMYLEKLLNGEQENELFNKDSK